MASALKQRKDAEQLAEVALLDSLKMGSMRLKEKKEKVNCRVAKSIGKSLERSYAGAVLRPANTMPRTPKSKVKDKIRLAYALHMFTNYPVPKHISQVWLTTPVHVARGTSTLNRAAALNANPYWPEMTRCFFLIGAGQSPYHHLYKDFLSRKEVHRLLTCRYDLDYGRALFWSTARTFTNDNAVALRIARSKLGLQDYRSPFWRDVVRFFAANPLPMPEINDFCDYLVFTKNRNPEFSLKGRTLCSLRSLMDAWHVEINLVKQIGHHEWAGLAIADCIHEDQGCAWKIAQILNSKNLAREGKKMRHCVSIYRDACIKGEVGIFSMTLKKKSESQWKPVLTIEVGNTGCIRQVKGFANRSATQRELGIIRLWSRRFGLILGRYM